MEIQEIKLVLEAALFAAGEPVAHARLQQLFDPPLVAEDVAAALALLAEDYRNRAIEIAEVAGGNRVQLRRAFAPVVARLNPERPQRYSRAVLETLALIAYRQPITRGEIEDIRGVSTSSHIVKTLLEREWIQVLGQREVPGRPSLYGTTRRFLDDFSLRAITDLPPLPDLPQQTDLFAAAGPQEPIALAVADAATPACAAADER